MTVLSYKSISKLELAAADLDCSVLAIGGVEDLEGAGIAVDVSVVKPHSFARYKKVFPEF